MDLSGLLDLQIPDSWYVLDPDRATRRESAARDVDARAAASAALAPFRDELVDILCGFAADAEEKGALFAAVYWEPTEHGPSTASLMVLSGRRSEPDDAQAEIAALAAGLSPSEPGDIGQRDVSELDLPMGPAVRLRVLVGSDMEEGGSLVIDASQVWVPLPDVPAMVIVSGSTPCLDLGDDLADVVGDVAASLTATGG